MRFPLQVLKAPSGDTAESDAAGSALKWRLLRVVFESVLGFVASMLAVLIVFFWDLGCSGGFHSENDCSSSTGILSWIVQLLPAVAVWLLGRHMDGRGRLIWTLLGAYAGFAISGHSLLTVVSCPLIGAILAYELSDFFAIWRSKRSLSLNRMDGLTETN